MEETWPVFVEEFGKKRINLFWYAKTKRRVVLKEGYFIEEQVVAGSLFCFSNVVKSNHNSNDRRMNN